MDHQFLDHNKQQPNIPKPMFDIIEPSIVRAQFIPKKDVSFTSYIQQSQNHHKKFITPQIGQNKTYDSDQISIFDAAKYFSGVHDNRKDQNSKVLGHNNLAPIPSRLSSVSSTIDDGSNFEGQNSNCTSNNYRARSFHATPTASSEASWNSQAGLLANPPGSIGVSLTKNLSPNNSSNSTSTTSNAIPRWSRISTKWFIPRQKCPCSGKKSVQVEERIEPNTPRMVDLRRSTSSNGSTTNYISPSWHSPRQYSPKNFGTTIPVTSPAPNVVTPQETRGCVNNNNNFNFNFNVKNHDHSNSNVVGPSRSFPNNSEVIGFGATTVTAATTDTTGVARIGGTTTANGFTFPILDNPPIGVKKMFNVIADPPRNSLEVFQPKSHPSPKSRRTSYEDDNVSDVSSDLFEIESFSTTYNPCRDSIDDEVVLSASSFDSITMKRLGIVCRNSSSSSNNNNNNNNNNNIMNLDENDGMNEPMTPSIGHNECYAPSEASIDWSVTTAEGFDRASLTNFSVSASEIGLYAAMRRESEINNGGGSGGGGGGEGRRGKQVGGKGNSGGGLLGCRCEKAVNVGPSPIKCSAEGGLPNGTRHVSGRPAQQPQGVAAHANGRWK